MWFKQQLVDNMGYKSFLPKTCIWSFY